MAAAATGNGVCAFAPMSHPAERAAFATRARWPQLIAPDENLASSVGLVSGLRRRGRGKSKGDNDGCDREQKVGAFTMYHELCASADAWAQEA